MYKPFLKAFKTSLIVFGFSSALVTYSYADKLDLKKEINIDASRQAADLKNKIFSYIDNVVITQGTLVIKADLVQVLTDNQTDEKTYLAKGEPATFSQKLDDGTPIYLQANEIKYQPGQNIVVISGNAELRQEGSKVSGSVITYNFVTEQVSADSEDNNRVKTVLQPKELDKK
ncbi:lipopolysaccharide transport periplasmic protein LptA [Thalassotalea profundi]|uniref:Lipopolysaccharide export system protein LptA n=1 Tax=Thalassotalea profundi TaxID=2036687 RepID=A0ABQ3IU99_9GAMM|nr:lipopolysaccharide transport periplasmic protein LptA [Thalassotalea profundi]GHE93143.1 lipopolysaccharide export system protein LptA [Thalassotalea profundi]